MTHSGDPLDRVVAVINGKGGVGKTSLTANLAGQCARSGFRVLAIDLDLSGNLGLDLGYAYTTDHGSSRADGGRAMVQSIWTGEDLVPLVDVRPNLDVIPGGRHLEMLSVMATGGSMSEDLPGGSVAAAFTERLRALSGSYDLTILDCAPGTPALQEIALAAARYIVVPTRTDAAGWEGLRMVGPRVKKAREVNPHITYLGVVVFAHAVAARRILRQTRAHLAEVADRAPLFDTQIRYSEAAAHDCRARGQLAHELADDARTRSAERLAALRGSTSLEMLPALSPTADNLAGDYERLAREMLHRIREHEQPAPLEPVATFTGAS